ncbi:helix-turn-helix domain-containing protein [Sphingomonas sp. NBWT7]|uniref:helix-turn-helix domain-containing protein n=1 Tax=Sphingomonas sp. NBWT7 TaxID=2596913 RepID=UPI001627104D|nr:helix-turn-helix domain-containing protein [Sphingomonas sp. NBWT7]QNE32391.1 helix-turn-helix domain-containing protein [Sphingomonas sp. NBWT7]
MPRSRDKPIGMEQGGEDAADRARDHSLAVNRFDTDAYKPSERHEAWANRHWPAIGMLFQSRPTAAFFNHAMTFRLGALAITRSYMAAQRYTRRAIDIRRDDCDGLLIPVTLAGMQSGDTPKRPIVTRRGEMSLIDLSLPEAHESTASHTILLAVPRAQAERAGIDVRALHGVSVPAPATRMFRRHLVEICRLAPHLTRAQAETLETATIDLLAVALAMHGTGCALTPRSIETAQKLAVRDLIARDLASPDLGVAKIMSAIGMSRTALYRLFEEDGGVQAHIRQQRLARVRGELVAAHPRERIADIAARWGFDDPAYLSRIFRQRYGISPSDYRRQAR